MLLRNIEMFTLKDLQDAAGNDGVWFGEQTREALAGRCLLDALEYLRAHPMFPRQFLQVVNAHTVRLVARCLSDPELKVAEMFDRMKGRLHEVCERLLKSRGRQFPSYGDDYWDWAAILGCFLEAQRRLPDGPIGEEAVDREMKSFKEQVERSLKKGLQAPGPHEWYGPATAAAAYFVLRGWSAAKGLKMQDTLTELQKQALQPIGDNNKYRDRKVANEHVVWHLGQVVAEFPDRAESQWRKVCDLLADVRSFPDRAQRVYALARVIQGAHAVADADTLDEALAALYGLEEHQRPLGEGIVGESVKGSLNILEALWPTLGLHEKSKIRAMMEALRETHTRANTINVVVAIEVESKAVAGAFKARGAKIEGDVNSESFVVRHRDYRAVVRKAKALIGTTDSVRRLLDEDQPKWVVMAGIAGSLGTKKPRPDGLEGGFVGPGLGDVVLAVSLAPYQIRDKERGGRVENARVPFGGTTWQTIPVDPGLFALAHEATEEPFPGGQSVQVWEGQIVTGTGIKDDRATKSLILAEFPGGLAVEEESFVVALMCMWTGTPCAIFRGISDLAEGDKFGQQKNEQEHQTRAAANAAHFAVVTIERLSRRW